MSAPLFIEYQRSRLHYHRFGYGDQWIICFHGYGEEGEKFLFLEEALSQTHTVIAIDLPFHGKTDWKGDLLLEPAVLMDIIRQIVPSEIKMQLMGYSMGGRVCLRLLEMYPQQITRLVLVAPDGLHRNPWQKLATQTFPGNQLFRLTMQYPGWMFAMMGLLTKLGLFNKSISRFVHHYLDDASERQKLYQRWTTMRRFRPSINQLKTIIDTHQVPVHVLFGKYDRVILSKHGFRLQKGLEHLISVAELEAGHHLLQEKYKATLLKMISP